MNVDWKIMTAAATAVVVAASLAALDLRSALCSIALGLAMLAVAVSDARRFIVPDVISLPAVPIGLLTSATLASSSAHTVVLAHLAAAGIGAATFYAIKRLYLLVRKRDGLGLGDVKLAAVAGAWTGADGLALVILLSCLLAFTFVLILALTKRDTVNAATPIPYGAFLAPSIWVVWFACAIMKADYSMQ